MQYLIVFVEGIVTFISPCLLPMLPLYLSYFAGGDGGNRKKVLYNALGFFLGFTMVFMILGAFAGTLGQFVLRYGAAINLVAGAFIVLFGLSYLGLFNFPSLKLSSRKLSLDAGNLNPGKSVLFGILFSITWTPCVSAFLGTALVLASQQGSVAAGVFMLFLFSLGLGIPFIASALLIDNLKSTFGFLKKHGKTVSMISGLLLIVLGILMMMGRLI